MIPPTHDTHILKKDVRWGEFSVGRLFDISTPKAKFNANRLNFNGKHPYVARGEVNNGIKGWIDEDERYLNDANTISFGQDTATMFFQKVPYFTGDKIKIFTLKNKGLNRLIALFIITAMRKSFMNFSWGSSSYNVAILKKTLIELPITANGTLDFAYMEAYIAKIESEYIMTLETKRDIHLKAYLKVAERTDYKLSDNDKKVLSFEPQWGEFRVGDLFDTIKRGKRIKSLDRINGTLPFITAGVNERGFSSYIGNPETEVFPKNSLTIDMFGTVFYRNHEYGADDHVAVLYNENNQYSKEALIYMGRCIEKSIEGKFSYSKNFYASDAYDVIVSLPKAENGTLDFAYMESYIKVQLIQEIENMIRGFNLKINATRYIVDNKIEFPKI